MAKTTNLNLELTDDNTTSFKDWRESINGVGDGDTIPKSNMQLIDEAIGAIEFQLAEGTGEAAFTFSTPVLIENLPITIKKGTEIYFSTNYSSNINYSTQIYDSAKGMDKFPALKMPVLGGYRFYYGNDVYVNITNYWNLEFNDSVENDYIKWDKDTQILTYKGPEEGVLDTSQHTSDVFDSLIITNATRLGDLENRVEELDATYNETLDSITDVLTNILGV